MSTNDILDALKHKLRPWLRTLFHVEIVYAAALAANLFHVEIVYGLGHSCEAIRMDVRKNNVSFSSSLTLDYFSQSSIPSKDVR